VVGLVLTIPFMALIALAQLDSRPDLLHPGKGAAIARSG
jgi:hypothetical protein